LQAHIQRNHGDHNRLPFWFALALREYIRRANMDIER